MKRFLVNATVDMVKDPKPPVLGLFHVEVWGKEPHDYVRTYEIQAKSDSLAAQEGITRFEEEMTRLFPEEN